MYGFGVWGVGCWVHVLGGLHGGLVLTVGGVGLGVGSVWFQWSGLKVSGTGVKVRGLEQSAQHVFFNQTLVHDPHPPLLNDVGPHSSSHMVGLCFP